MNNIDNKYLELLQDILDNGVEKEDRTGTGTISVFGRQIRHKMSEGFPALTTKKLAFKTMVTELKWFLKGDTNIQYLVQNGCHIWDGDCYKHFLNRLSSSNYAKEFLEQQEFIEKIKTDAEFAKKWGGLGPIYGHQWRNWSTVEVNMPGFDAHIDETCIDQIQNLLDTLRTNPDSRRMMVNAWNVSDLPNMKLPPCHYGFQVYTRELSYDERLGLAVDTNERWVGWMTSMNDETRLNFMTKNGIPTRAISLMFNMRSTDVPLGLPFNIASYGLLLEMIAKEVNMVPDELIGNLGDVHIYKNQLEGVKEQLTREPLPLPRLKINSSSVLDGEVDCELIDYKHQGTIKFPLSN